MLPLKALGKDLEGSLLSSGGCQQSHVGTSLQSLPLSSQSSPPYVFKFLSFYKGTSHWILGPILIRYDLILIGFISAKILLPNKVMLTGTEG